MQIKVNTKATEAPDGVSIQQLLQSKNLQGGSIAVALNGAIVHADKWATTTLKPGDNLELIRHVGGG